MIGDSEGKKIFRYCRGLMLFFPRSESFLIPQCCVLRMKVVIHVCLCLRNDSQFCEMANTVSSAICSIGSSLLHFFCFLRYSFRPPLSYFESLGSWLSLLRQNSQLREIRKLATVATKGYDVDEGPQGEGQGAASYCGNAEESGV